MGWRENYAQNRYFFVIYEAILVGVEDLVGLEFGVAFATFTLEDGGEFYVGFGWLKERVGLPFRWSCP